MKLLIATDTYYPHVNGASYFTQRLAYHLHMRGHKVIVVAPSRKLQHEKYELDGVPVLGIRSLPIFLYKGFTFPPTFPVRRYKNFRFSLSLFEKESLEKVLLQFHPDVIHLQNHFLIGRSVFKLAREHQYPIVGTNHFMPENLIHYTLLPTGLADKVKQWAWQDFRKIYEQCDIITTPTASAAKLIKQIGFSKPVMPISCGIDRKRFSPKNKGSYLRKKYNLPNEKLLLYVGRLDKEKNLDVVLQALSFVSPKTRLHFVIAGIGAMKERLESLVRNYNLNEKVTFMDFVSDKDLPNLYALSKCFIIAGTAELQSIATMEAMASGLPVLAVNAVALPELVRHKKNGFLFNLDEPENMAKYIEIIFSDESLRKKMAQESLRIIKKHNMPNVIRQFEQVYLTAIKLRKKKPDNTPLYI